MLANFPALYHMQCDYMSALGHVELDLTNPYPAAPIANLTTLHLPYTSSTMLPIYHYPKSSGP